jgi:YfiH family protein
VFAFQDTSGPVGIAFTDRHGGVSGGPFASLNLSSATGDHPATVGENVDLVASAFVRGHADEAEPSRLPSGAHPPPVVAMQQVHGADVAVVDSASLRSQVTPVADALVTAEPGVVLMVRVADCVPVLLADVGAGVVGAVHAGRPGLVAGVVPHALEALRSLGAGDVRAWVGPHVCGACYEVPEQLRADVAAVVPEAFAQTSWGTPAVDVGAGVLAQLRAGGVRDVSEVRRCTIEDDDLFSYRRQGKESGRAAGLVWVRP